MKEDLRWKTPTYPASLSILISSYNKEDYILDCLSVLKELDIPQYEIIIVDDGSKDKSLQIIESFSNQIPNMRVFIQKNGGSASSRNRALSEAQNDVLLFLDMDDQINQETLRRALNEISNTHFDIAMLNYETFPNNTRGTVISKSDILETLEMNLSRESFYMAMGFWRNLYSRRFIIENHLKFMPTFSQVGNQYFILDDLFWLLHIATLETQIHCFPDKEILYRYRIAPQHDKNSWRRYKDQLVLLPKAFEIFFYELEKCKHTHDNKWLSHKSNEILIEHLKMLDMRNIHFALINLVKLFREHHKFLGSSIFSTIFLKMISTVLIFAIKNSIRDLFMGSRVGSKLWKDLKKIAGRK
jgi:glycosyltransferase involved in cell wall biosynthesis